MGTLQSLMTDPEIGLIQGLPDKPKGNGGKLDINNNSKNITYYSNGGLHETNKYGGIPLGNNKVEEGELRYKDFIFSNRF